MTSISSHRVFNYAATPAITATLLILLLFQGHSSKAFVIVERKSPSVVSSKLERSLISRNHHHASYGATPSSWYRAKCLFRASHKMLQHQQQRRSTSSSSTLYMATLSPLIDNVVTTADTLLSYSSTSASNIMTSETLLAFVQQINLSIDKDAAESLAGPFFGLSLFPYLAFLYFLDYEGNKTPKGRYVRAYRGKSICAILEYILHL